MEEMHRTHKEPVWGWVAVVADLIAQVRKPRLTATRAKTPRSGRGVVTPWSTNTPAGWSA
jgi:hypothetical protein